MCIFLYALPMRQWLQCGGIGTLDARRSVSSIIALVDYPWFLKQISMVVPGSGTMLAESRWLIFTSGIFGRMDR